MLTQTATGQYTVIMCDIGSQRVINILHILMPPKLFSNSISLKIPGTYDVM